MLNIPPYPYMKSVLFRLIAIIIFLLLLACETTEVDIEKCSCDSESLFNAEYIDSLKLDQIPSFWHPDSIVNSRNSMRSWDVAAIAGKEFYYSRYQRSLGIEVFETHDMAIYNLATLRSSISIPLYEGPEELFGEWWLYDDQFYQYSIWFNKLNINFQVTIRYYDDIEMDKDSIAGVVQSIPPILIERVNEFVNEVSNESQD